jgi:ATP-dependent DNA helicase RecG
MPTPHSPNELHIQLSRGMDVDLHWFPEDVSVSKLAETLIGLANTGGGNVFLGIAPRSGEVIGVQDAESVMDLVFQAALLSDPPLVLPVPSCIGVEFQNHQDLADVYVITVPPGLPHVYSIEGRYFGREGSHNIRLSSREIRQLMVTRSVVNFESQVPPEASIKDLDPQKISEYIDTIQFAGGGTSEEILLWRGCLKIVQGDLRPTYAAILLFGHHPQQWLPNATILAVRFPGDSFSDSYVKQDIAGTLPEQLQLAEAFVHSNLQTEVRLIGLVRQETLEYPFEAVREVLVNAVAHRDYNHQGDNIHFHIFDDRLEIHSPGRLPGPMNLDNLLEARFSRNAVITQVLSDLGFVERLGYGLNRVFHVMQQQGFSPPSFEEVAGSFRVKLIRSHKVRREEDYVPDLSKYVDSNLNQRQELALGYIARNRRITNRKYQELCPDVHPETLRRDLANLVNQGILLKIGDKRATYYILKDIPTKTKEG